MTPVPVALMPHVSHAVPVDQPHSVHQIAARLFSHYTIDGGSVHLAGCLLDDRLFLRLDFAAGPERLYLDAEGRQTHPAMVERLGLDQLEPVNRPPRRCDRELETLLLAGQQVARQLDPAAGEPTAATAVWAKHAEGKLRFTIGESSVDLPFAGWAKTLEPPPFVCPYTGVETFHLAATDDGRIVAAAKVAACEQTGRRALDDELVACATTGKRVLSDLIAVCPVTAQRVLGAAMLVCRTCRQRVAAGAVQGGQCLACHSLAPVAKDDPRMARLLHEHPDWERWGHWKLAETATVYVLSAARWLKRVLMVVDRQTLELKDLSLGNRFFGGWQPVPADQRHLALSE